MNDVQALNIVTTALADGVDPETGEIYPPESPYQRSHIVRALYAASRALERANEAEQRKRRLPANTGKPWSEEDDARLGAGYDAGRPVEDLSREHSRTRGAIQARLMKLGKLRL
jgi:hypothetical protein